MSPLPHALSTGRRARVLVAEDDDDLREVVVSVLQKDGYEVVGAADGGQLLILITNQYRLRPASEPIDLIVTDVRMPAVDGLDIVESLREASWTTPIVIMTAFADTATCARVGRLGAVLLDKPVKMSVLRACVADLLSKRSQDPNAGSS